MKHLARYLVDSPRLVQEFLEQALVTKVTVRSDIGHAGCIRTRKSTTCVPLRHGVNVIKAGSWSQSAIALSRAESEYQAAVKASSIGLGAKSMFHDMDQKLSHVELKLDASAAKSILQRKVVGRVRHLALPMLWVQQEQRVAIGKIDSSKTSRKVNTADLGTKYLSRGEIDGYLATLNCCWMAGRSSIALRTAV